MARSSRSPQSSGRPNLKGLPDVLRQRSLSEGLWNGRKGWMAVGAVMWGVRGVRWALQRNERVLMREVLEPGQTIVVREIPTKATKVKKQAKPAKQAKPKKPSRKQRKAAKRASKKLRKTKPSVAAADVVEKPAKLTRKDRKAIKRAAKLVVEDAA